MEHRQLERHACTRVQTFGDLGDRSGRTRPGVGADVGRPQEFLYVNGVGSDPTRPINLSSEDLWLVKIRFADDEPPDVATIPSVSLASVGDSGGVEWSGDWWHRIHVTGDSDWAQVLGERMAVFTLGEVVVQISDLPDAVAWWVEFERLGELN